MSPPRPKGVEAEIGERTTKARSEVVDVVQVGVPQLVETAELPTANLCGQLINIQRVLQRLVPDEIRVEELRKSWFN